MKKLKKIIIITIIAILFLVANYALAVDKTDIEKYIKENNINVNSVNASDIITMYQNLSKEHSNEEIANMVDEYSEELENKGVSKEAISVGKKILTSTDARNIK